MSKINNIKELQKKANLTTEELAQNSGLNYTTLTRYKIDLLDLRNARLDTLIKLATTLKCKISDLFVDERFVDTIKKIS